MANTEKTKKTDARAQQHTPGPWKVNPTGDVGQWLIGVAECPIATVETELPDKTWKANARLIAAAPELLNGCNALLGLLQLVNSNRDTPPWIRDALTNNHRIDEARAAVAQSTTRARERSPRATNKTI